MWSGRADPVAHRGQVADHGHVLLAAPTVVPPGVLVDPDHLHTGCFSTPLRQITHEARTAGPSRKHIGGSEIRCWPRGSASTPASADGVDFSPLGPPGASVAARPDGPQGHAIIAELSGGIEAAVLWAVTGAPGPGVTSLVNAVGMCLPAEASVLDDGISFDASRGRHADETWRAARWPKN